MHGTEASLGGVRHGMASVVKQAESQSPPAQQACAVPFRRIKSRIEFCLVTSSSGRWLFPKGYIDAGTSPSETALSEAYEEAGLHGRIVDEPLGCYEAPKNGDTRTVMAWLMEVSHCDDRWPESTLRQRRWVSPSEARELLCQPRLLEMLQAALIRLRRR